MPVSGNAAQVAAKLDAASSALADLSVPLEEAAGVILARANPPRRSGRLAASGRAVGSPAAARVVYAAPYAVYVHAANPWLATALEQTATTAAAIVADGVAAAIDRTI